MKKTVEPTDGHHKKLVTDFKDLNLHGRYFAISLNEFHPNVPLRYEYSRDIKSFSLLELTYHNLWRYRIETLQHDGAKMIDSGGFQHQGSYEYYNQPVKMGKKNYNKVLFLRPESILESHAKTRGWLWFDPLEKNILPHRFIFFFRIYDPGETSGYVRDTETLEFILDLKNWAMYLTNDKKLLASP